MSAWREAVTLSGRHVTLRPLSRYRWCTNLLVRGDIEHVAGGDSVMIARDGELTRVHVHTDDPDAVVALFDDVRQVDVSDMWPPTTAFALAPGFEEPFTSMGVRVVEELTPNALSLAEIQGVLQLLLEENVAIRDLVRIFEVLSARARMTKDPEQLVEALRGVLGPAISAAHAIDGRLQAITFEPLVEQSLLEALRSGENGTFLAIDPAQAERLALEAAQRAEQAEQTGAAPVLLCSAPLRPAVRRLTRAAAPRLPVLSYAELGTQLQVETIGVISLAQTADV